LKINTGEQMPKVGDQVEKGGRRLQPQQQKFLDNYIHKDMTQTGAARAAGYKSPNVRAVQLLNNPVVRERMEEMRNELETKYGVSVTKSVRDMQRLRDEAWQAGNFSAAIKAEELRLKVTGLMVARSHVTHENVDNLTRDQIVEQLQEFMDRAKNRMIDVTPAENPIKPEQIDITYDNGKAAG
jgi:phage terminase small subunit|tara:strand:+ start:246 stop:794 length:549 start_codon:yes stop_codon:yes gene_type:complete